MSILASCVVSAVGGSVAGYLLCGLLVARDRSVVKLADDEIIVKKPAEGLILMAVTTDLARRIISRRDAEETVREARQIYRDSEL